MMPFITEVTISTHYTSQILQERTIMMPRRHQSSLEKTTLPLLLNSCGHRHQFLHQNQLGGRRTLFLFNWLWYVKSSQVNGGMYTLSGSSVLTKKLGLMVGHICDVHSET